MNPCLDKVEIFLNGVSVNFDQSLYDVTTTFSNADNSCGSKQSFQIEVNHDPFISSVREWLLCRSQRLLNETSSLRESKTDIADSGVAFIETVTYALEAINQNKDELRQNFKVPQDDDSLPLHFNMHKNFLNMISCLSQVGKRYEDYSKLTTEQTTYQMKKHLEKLESTEKQISDVQHISLCNAGDMEAIRRKL